MSKKFRLFGLGIAAWIALSLRLPALAGASGLSAFDQFVRLRPPGPLSASVAVPPPGLWPASFARTSVVPAPQLQVPHRIQEGPTCGLYALGMVMDYYYEENSGNLTAYVAASDAWRRGAATIAPNTDKLIFDTAKQSGYFAESERIIGQDGGMYVADQLGLLAGRFGYKYRLIENAAEADIRAVIDRRHPALVAFDVSRDGRSPILAGGARAHWGVVVGYYSSGGEDWFIVQHGWTDREYYFSAAGLAASMAQVQPTLRSRIVEVLPGSGAE